MEELFGKIIETIRKDDLEQAITLLNSALEKNDRIDDLSIVSAEFNDLKKSIKHGFLTQDQITSRKNRLRFKLIELARVFDSKSDSVEKPKSERNTIIDENKSGQNVSGKNIVLGGIHNVKGNVRIGDNINQQILYTTNLGRKLNFDSIINQLLNNFEGRQKDLGEVLNKITNQECDYLFITGQPGIGKSSFMAKLHYVLKNKEHEIDELDSIHSILYLIKQGTESSRFTNLLASLESEFDRLTSIEKGHLGESADFHYKLKLYDQWLVDNDQKIVVLIDGLDESEGIMPHLITDHYSNIFIIYASRQTASLDDFDIEEINLKSIRNTYELYGLEIDDFRKVIINFLKDEAEDLFRIHSLSQLYEETKGNPLHISIFLNEWSKGELKKKGLTNIPSIENLYRRIFKRLSKRGRALDAVQLLAFSFNGFSLRNIDRILSLNSTESQLVLSSIKEITSTQKRKYVISHKSFRDFIVEKQSRNKYHYHKILCDFCCRWQEFNQLKSPENVEALHYVLLYYSFHLYELASKEKTNEIEHYTNTLLNLAKSDVFLLTQAKETLNFQSSFDIFSHCISLCHYHDKQDQFVEIGIQAAKVHILKNNFYERIIHSITEDEVRLDESLKMIASYQGKNKSILFFYMLQYHLFKGESVEIENINKLIAFASSHRIGQTIKLGEILPKYFLIQIKKKSLESGIKREKLQFLKSGEVRNLELNFYNFLSKKSKDEIYDVVPEHIDDKTIKESVNQYYKQQNRIFRFLRVLWLIVQYPFILNRNIENEQGISGIKGIILMVSLWSSAGYLTYLAYEADYQWYYCAIIFILSYIIGMIIFHFVYSILIEFLLQFVLFLIVHVIPVFILQIWYLIKGRGWDMNSSAIEYDIKMINLQNKIINFLDLNFDYNEIHSQISYEGKSDETENHFRIIKKYASNSYHKLNKLALKLAELGKLSFSFNLLSRVKKSEAVKDEDETSLRLLRKIIDICPDPIKSIILSDTIRKASSQIKRKNKIKLSELRIIRESNQFRTQILSFVKIFKILLKAMIAIGVLIYGFMFWMLNQKDIVETTVVSKADIFTSQEFIYFLRPIILVAFLTLIVFKVLSLIQVRIQNWSINKVIRLYHKKKHFGSNFKFTNIFSNRFNYKIFANWELEVFLIAILLFFIICLRLFYAIFPNLFDLVIWQAIFTILIWVFFKVTLENHFNHKKQFHLPYGLINLFFSNKTLNNIFKLYFSEQNTPYVERVINKINNNNKQDKRGLHEFEVRRSESLKKIFVHFINDSHNRVNILESNNQFSACKNEFKKYYQEWTPSSPYNLTLPKFIYFLVRRCKIIIRELMSKNSVSLSQKYLELLPTITRYRETDMKSISSFDRLEISRSLYREKIDIAEKRKDYSSLLENLDHLPDWEQKEVMSNTFNKLNAEEKDKLISLLSNRSNSQDLISYTNKYLIDKFFENPHNSENLLISIISNYLNYPTILAETLFAYRFFLYLNKNKNSKKTMLEIDKII